jgi:hypothetical protein
VAVSVFVVQDAGDDDDDDVGADVAAVVLSSRPEASLASLAAATRLFSSARHSR